MEIFQEHERRQKCLPCGADTEQGIFTLNIIITKICTKIHNKANTKMLRLLVAKTKIITKKHKKCY